MKDFIDIIDFEEHEILILANDIASEIRADLIRKQKPEKNKTKAIIQRQALESQAIQMALKKIKLFGKLSIKKHDKLLAISREIEEVDPKITFTA